MDERKIIKLCAWFDMLQSSFDGFEEVVRAMLEEDEKAQVLKDLERYIRSIDHYMYLLETDVRDIESLL